MLSRLDAPTSCHAPVDASHELTFAENLACSHARNDVLMNLNAFTGVNACSDTEKELRRN